MQKKYFITGFRLPKEDKENLAKLGLFVYDLRECGKTFSIERSVGVNFYGTLITNFEINFPKTGRLFGLVLDGYDYLKNEKAVEVYRLNDIQGKEKRT